LAGIKKYGVKVTFNGMTSQPNFIKIYKLVEKLLGWGAHRQNGNLISSTFFFKKSRIKIVISSADIRKI
jgi:hypothetical protein